MRTTASFSFYCRESKKDRNGLAPIELGITINGSRKFINCAMKCSPSEFNCVGRKRRPKHIQDYIDAQRLNVSKIMSEMATNGIPLTAEALRGYLRTGGVKSYTINNLFDDYFRLLRKRVGVSLTEKVYNKYELVKRLFSEHINFDLEASSITPGVIQEFYATLKAKYQDSTSCGMMTKLKTVIKYGIDNGKVKVNPFQGTKICKGVKEIKTITHSQLQTIINHQFVPRVQKVADMFIFACGSGLAFADCIALKPQDFTIRDGNICIFKERQKTGVKFYSVLLPWAVDIYQKYAGDFSRLQISNQKTNQYLKEIQDVCGIETSLHFHLARHFYAMFLLNKKVPITSVQKAIGHSNLNMTMHYAKALESTVIDDIAKII